MKAIINDIQIEGTPEEIVKYQQLSSALDKDISHGIISGKSNNANTIDSNGFGTVSGGADNIR